MSNNIVHLNNIHETAIIYSGAEIAKDVEIGPYTIIGGNVKIDSGTEIGAHVVIEGQTRIGKDNKIFHGAVIGREPQDLKFEGEKGCVEIGNENTIREFATIHCGTEAGSGVTKIGDNNLIMAYCHVAHDCQLKNNITITNAVDFGEHVIVEDSVVITGLAEIYEFVKIGRMAMIGAHSKVTKDIPPYILVDGNPASVHGINVVGLRRNGVTPELRKEIKQAYKYLYRSDNNISQAIKKMDKELNKSSEIEHFLRFLRNTSREICR
ncbi:acyl-ACP--UDP-N-acetylglucosamine O-acyltransferase [Sporohalobacter salinus]|uniref:acyl-ACP--UDP-N-acetylglucosamine O-acyltransferase n=1 Tax=Sporohalobacter salinus TaxID=1494606 RepID=UPI0030B82081|nr:UDP-N-acetylglucosamine acyltransferase [Sporohalobacter salinus]